MNTRRICYSKRNLAEEHNHKFLPSVLQKIETADIISTIDRIYASAVIVNEIVEAKSRGKKHKDELQRRYKIIKEERIGSNERRN